MHETAQTIFPAAKFDAAPETNSVPTTDPSLALAAKLTKIQMFRRLADQRQMTSLIDKEIISEGKTFQFTKDNWVPLYYDTENKVTSDDLSMTAYRAVAERGEVLWLIFRKGRKHGYHSVETCPFDAFHQASEAYAERARVRAIWPQVDELAKRLRARKLDLTVTREDAQNSALCFLGTQYFLRRFGKEQIVSVSGFWLAWLMRIEPQIGFILYTAAKRNKIEF